MANGEPTSVRLFIVLGIISLFGIITFALAAATLGTLNKRLGVIDSKLSEIAAISPTTITSSASTAPTSTATFITTTRPSQNETLATSIKVEDVLTHLGELQKIANAANGTRAINTIGFNQTLKYITDTLRKETNFTVKESFFFVRDFALQTNPILISTVNGVSKNYTYSSDPTKADFLHARYSTKSNPSTSFELTIIPNGGCEEADWRSASGSTNGRVALIKRGGSCAFRERAAQAPKFNVTGILFYNDGTSSDNMSPVDISVGQDNALPAMFLSYNAGQALADAVSSSPMNVTIQLGIDVRNLPNFTVGNICADTLTGNMTQTIVIGSHTDSVPAGAGINDNGSGSAANLGLAIALHRLFQTSTYAKYKYRVRFCWWGAEEVGLLGSADHVKQAKVALTFGERLQDYLINLNYDMLGSPNYIFGIYDGQTAKNGTPAIALPGSNKISDLFRGWFDGQKLPWSNTSFDGRSDYGPFLAEGIVAGGLFSGADGKKSAAERDRYDQMLGQGMGGIADATYDPCYHKACDSIQNVNKFVLDKMVQAAAYVLEYLGQHNDLKGWLYPNLNITRVDTHE